MKKKQRTRYPLVAVKFYDHASVSDKDASLEPLVCECIGVLYKVKPTHYVICTWICDESLGDRQNNEYFVILKSAVIKLRKLR